MAAITHGVSTASTTNATSYTSGAFTPAADDLLVVFVGTQASDATAPTLTSSVSGKTFTLADSYAFTGYIYAFVADQLASNESQTVTFDCTGFAASNCTIHVERISGMTKTGASAVLQSTGTTGGSASTTPATTFSAPCQTGNPTMAALIKNEQTEVVEPTGWTDLGNTPIGFPDTRCQSVGRDSGFTSTTITWGGTSDGSYSVIALELDASGGGPTTHTASGSLQSSAAVITGAGSRTAKATGSLASGAAVIGGAAIREAIASGAVAAQLASIVGAASVAGGSVTASGAIQSGPAVVDGSATRVFSASGTLESQEAAVAGVASIALSTASGALRSGPAAIVGAATKTTSASGALQSEAASIVGEAARGTIVATGVLGSGLALVSGLILRKWYSQTSPGETWTDSGGGTSESWYSDASGPGETWSEE